MRYKMWTMKEMAAVANYVDTEKRPYGESGMKQLAKALDRDVESVRGAINREMKIRR